MLTQSKEALNDIKHELFTAYALMLLPAFADNNEVVIASSANDTLSYITTHTPKVTDLEDSFELMHMFLTQQLLARHPSGNFPKEELDEYSLRNSVEGSGGPVCDKHGLPVLEFVHPNSGSCLRCLFDLAKTNPLGAKMKALAMCMEEIKGGMSKRDSNQCKAFAGVGLNYIRPLVPFYAQDDELVVHLKTGEAFFEMVLNEGYAVPNEKGLRKMFEINGMDITKSGQVTVRFGGVGLTFLNKPEAF